MKITGLIIACIGVCLAVSCSHLPSGPTRTHLDGTVLPCIDFRKADIRDIVDWLNGSMVMGMEEVPSIVLLLPHNHTVDPVTVEMHNASVTEILRVVAKLTDSKFYIRGNQPYLEPRDPRPLSPTEIKAKDDEDPFK